MRLSLSRLILCSAALLLMSTAAYADSYGDPRVIIKDAHCDDCGVGQNFHFSLPTNQGKYFNGDLTFQNTSDVTWYSLILTEKGVPWQDISCGANAFFNFCQVVPSKKNPNVAKIEFLNILPDPKGGIAPGTYFTLNFGPGKDGGQWPAGLKFGGHGGTGIAPEPGTMALLLTGVGAIVTRRKMRKNAAAA